MEKHLLRPQVCCIQLCLLALIIQVLIVLALPVTGLAGEADSDFDLPLTSGTFDKPKQSTFGANLILGALGLPGLAPASDNYHDPDPARQIQNNLDPSAPSSSSVEWNSDAVVERLLEQALSLSSGYMSSWAEGWLQGYGNARINFRISSKGRLSGSGDFLLPLYDSQSTAVFTQLGLRTMAGNRVIGNLGFGQRFFVTENFALGYNLFLDQDFTRNHTRGGAGFEAWYDWLRLSVNYYLPLSAWKDSGDFEGALVTERPAEGLDARLTGYLPFYPNLAVTGAYEHWKGDRVGSLGSSDLLQTDPKVWSCGLVWTPVPAVAVSLNQRFSSGHKETQVGLSFNYRFGMSREDQFSSATVAEMRTVDASRHDFVDRQYEMILAYQAKQGVYNIVLLRVLGDNIFEFQITDGLGVPVPGQSLTVTAQSAGGVVDVSQDGRFTTDQNGIARVELLPSPDVAQASVTINAGDSSRTFDSLIITPPPTEYSLTASPDDIMPGEATVVVFTFLRNGESVGSGVTVAFEENASLGLNAISVSTDSNGQVTLSLTPTARGIFTVSAAIDEQTVTCAIRVDSDYMVSFESVLSPEGDFITGTLPNDFKSTAILTVTVTRDGVNQVVGCGEVGNAYWSLDPNKNQNINPDATWWKRSGFNTFGLSWSQWGPPNPGTDNIGPAPSGATAYLTDIVGSRSVTVTGGICISGNGASNQADCESSGGTWHTEDLTLTFGNGPLSVFGAVPSEPRISMWSTNSGYSDTDTNDGNFANPETNVFLAINYAGGIIPNLVGFSFAGGTGSHTAEFPSTGWTATGMFDGFQTYYPEGCKLARREQLQAVANTTGKGAALAAGWPTSGTILNSNHWYWTGEVYFNVVGRFYAMIVSMDTGLLSGTNVRSLTPGNLIGVQ